MVEKVLELHLLKASKEAIEFIFHLSNTFHLIIVAPLQNM